MPLARHRGEITRWFERFGHGDGAVAELSGRAFGAVDNHVVQMAHAGAMRIQSGQQRGARWTATRCVVELREAQSASGQFIEVGRGNLATIATQIRPAHIVHQNRDHIRRRLGRGNGDGSDGAQSGDAGSERAAMFLLKKSLHNKFFTCNPTKWRTGLPSQPVQVLAGRFIALQVLASLINSARRSHTISFAVRQRIAQFHARFFGFTLQLGHDIRLLGSHIVRFAAVVIEII